MTKYASKVVEQAKAWLGYNEYDGSHTKIIDIYNAQNPLPVGYKVKYTDPWCATFVSAVAVQLEYTDIIPTECSCSRMIELLKKIDSFVEDDAYVPKPGDILFYDWEDSGVGENTSSPDHVGIVEKVDGNIITIIEGNYSNSVKRRSIKVNGRYIRGYGVPKYDAEVKPETTTKNKGDYAMEMKYLRKGCKGEDVRAVQILLIGRGYSCGSAGADGDFGSATDSAVRKYQEAKGLDVDGIVGNDTMGSLLGVS